MEFWIGLLVIYVIYRIVKRLSQSNTSTDLSQINIGSKTYASDANFTQYGRPKGKPARWYGYNEYVKVGGYDIHGGLIYVGEVLLDLSGYGNDASLINPKLKHISAKPWEAGEEMGYWPRYETIPARCRGAYLQWLASGRSDPSAYIGYVFLFFSESAEDDSDLKQAIIPSSATVNPLISLDKNHRELFDHLRTREVWDRDVIRNMCQKLGLMMDGAMEVLNEWAFDNSNAPLIEDGETIYVDINLAKEIIND